MGTDSAKMALRPTPKLIIIGDGAIGKTCLVARFNKDGFTDNYEPTMFDDQPFDLVFDEIDDVTGPWTRFLDPVTKEPQGVEDDKRTLAIWDTAGQESLEELRHLAYPKTHVILLGYNTSRPDSLENCKDKWQEELKENAAPCEITKNAPCILVGTMSDKRDDEAAAGNPADTYVTAAQGWAAAKGLGCYAFIETSAKADTGCSECLDLAVKAAFTYSSSLNAKEETQANPLKIEDFEPKAAGAAPAKKAAEAATGGDAAANTTAPANEEAVAKQEAPAKEAAPAKETPKATGKKDAPAGDSGCCVIA